MPQEEPLALPPGYVRWYCPTCTASCNFEAMQWCGPSRLDHPEADCGFMQDNPESLGGAFEFMVKEEHAKEVSTAGRPGDP